MRSLHAKVKSSKKRKPEHSNEEDPVQRKKKIIVIIKDLRQIVSKVQANRWKKEYARCLFRDIS